MTDEEVPVETWTSPSTVSAAERMEDQGPLVAVTFQKDPLRKQKYLESEPKALGLTQIVLSVFQMCSVGFICYTVGLGRSYIVTLQLIGSVLVIVAGILALAAQNLHLPTLKACLGLQVVACVVSILMLFTVAVIEQGEHNIAYMCWQYNEDYSNQTTYGKTVNCNAFLEAYTHFNAESIVVEVVLVAISATLVAYCCKVINCCSPSSRMPVITVQAPPPAQP